MTAAEVARYRRHLALPEVGEAGQARLRHARVLLVGTGGLGSPVALYLAAAGVGHLTIVDDDRVDLSNLQRQLLHATDDVGRPKAASARDRLHALNPHVTVDARRVRLTRANARDVLRGHDVVVDGSDNFATRYAVNDACVALGVPNVYGAVSRFDGQASVFAPRNGPGGRGPCYRCMFPEPPPAGTAASCDAAGVLGVLPGLVGTVQATEALKLLLGIGAPLVGRLLLVDALEMRFHTIALRRDPNCVACGDTPRPYAALPDVPDDACATDAGASVPDGDDGEITPGALADRLRAAGPGPPIVVLDVRDAWEYTAAHVPGARLVPLATLANALDGLLGGAVGAEPAPTLHPAREVVVCCARGPRSRQAATLLRARGFTRVRMLAGGVERWAREGRVVEAS